MNGFGQESMANIMGIRGRNGEKSVLIKYKQSLSQAKKKFTRNKAEKALTVGADPTEERFVGHINYHIRVRAWHLQGRPMPEKLEDQNKFLVKLQGTDLPRDPVKAEQFVEMLRARYLK